jgi:hypothetical protein
MYAHKLTHLKIDLQEDLMVKSIVVLSMLVTLNGCAVYTVANTVTYIATDKSIMDHGSSTLAQADCDAVRVIRNGTYYCEVRDISVTYNRNRF